MRLLNKLTLKSLRLNRKRTAVTVVGIILATALLSVVSTMAVSFHASLIEYQKKVHGDFHYVFYDVPLSEVDSMEKNRNVESCFEMAGIGYAKLDGSVNAEKPYLYLAAMDKEGFANSSVQLVEGRFPENDSEILVSKHIWTNGGVKYRVGDSLTLEVGRRFPKGGSSAGDSAQTALNQWNFTPDGPSGEDFLVDFSKTYTIVGVTERLSNRFVEDLSSPGYTVLTFWDRENRENLPSLYGGVDVFVRFSGEGLRDKTYVTGELLGLDPRLYKGFCEGTLTPEELISYRKMWDEIPIKRFLENNQLVWYETYNLADSNLQFVYGIAVVVLFIIVGTSAFCISNSFAISITDKMRQYGMLASVGATSGQIKKNVYYEAAILALCGIPAGVLLGIFACWILVNVVGGLLLEALNFELVFHVNWVAIAFSVLFGVVTIFLSAARPARRSGKVSPLVAINGSSGGKLTANGLKMPGFVKKIFGIGGVLAYKNMKRNRKSYRVITVSLVVSVSIFIALGYFVRLSLDVTQHFVGNVDYNLSVDALGLSEDSVKKITMLEGVKRGSFVRDYSFYEDVPSEFPFSEEAKKYGVTDDMAYIPFFTLGSQEFGRYLKELGFSWEEFGDKGIYINTDFRYSEEENRYVLYPVSTLKAGDVIKGRLSVWADEEHTRGTWVEDEIVIGCVTDKRPIGLRELTLGGKGAMIVRDKRGETESRKLMDMVSFAGVYLDCDNADLVQARIIDEGLAPADKIYNEGKEQRENRALYLVIAIFLYGLIAVISLIGGTNIFNSVTKNMELRSREFAMLRSMGMTGREFNRMVCLESMFYGGKALFLGVLIGTILSLLIYRQMANGVDLGYHFPIVVTLIAVLAVVALIFGIMRYSLVRIRRQNIVETIRQENI